MSFVEESADHRLFIAAALLEDGRLVHVHRKLFLPTYGLFDERRFFAAGDLLRAVPSRLGIGLGIGVCEDFWHLPVPQLLALDGAQVLINVSSSPGRDLAATNEVGLGTASSWRTLMRTYAQLTTSYVVFVNRVGVEESISFWGGSEVIAPDGTPIFGAPLYDEGLYPVELDLDEIRRARIGLPLLRDERLELEVRELERIVAERAGLAVDTTAEPGAEPGLDVRPAGGLDPPTVSVAFELPAELAIDTDVARRVIGEFIRGQLRQAGFERAVARAVRRDRFGARGLPRRRGDRPGAAAVRADAISDLVARVADRRRGRRRAARLRIRARRDQRRWSMATSAPTGRRRARRRAAARRARSGAATSWPGCGWPCCTTAR